MCVCVYECSVRCEHLLLGAKCELADVAQFSGKLNVLPSGGIDLEALKLVGITGGALQIPETSVSTGRHSCRCGNSTAHATVRRVLAS